MDETFSRPMLDNVARENGISPDDHRLVLQLAALGLVNTAWRNSPLEDWHAGPNSRLDDGEMLRANAQSCALARTVLDQACGTDDPKLPDLDTLEEILTAIYEALFDPGRVLPDGRTLTKLGGRQLPELQDHGDRALGGVLALAEREGVESALLYVAVHAALACSRWWGTPWWSDIVAAFVRALDNPDDPHWGKDGGLWPKRTPPPDVVDCEQLRGLLLDRPYDLSHDAARYCVSAGLGYLTEPIIAWRERNRIRVAANDEGTSARRIRTAAVLDVEGGSAGPPLLRS